MEMHQIRYFLAVARTLNFSRAAEECHVAQPSLSRAIQKLEDELGGALFRRERSYTHLTDLGRLMVPMLTRCFEGAMAAKSAATSYRKGDRAPLRLALSHSINLGLLATPLSELVKSVQGLELKFVRGTAGEVADALKNGDAELAVACDLGDDWERFDSWSLFTESLELAVNPAHPLAGRPAVRIEDLAGQRLLNRPYCEYAAAIAAALSAEGMQPTASDHVVSDSDLLVLLRANIGIGILPRSTSDSADVLSRPIDGLDLTCSVRLYAVAGRQRSAAANLLLKLLRARNWSDIIPTIVAQTEAARPAAR